MSTTMPTILQVDLVTPSKSLLSTEALSVTAPGEEGDFGVLPGHIPFLSLLRPGALQVEAYDQNFQFVISFGYAQVLPDRVTILVDQVAVRDQINHEEALQLVQELATNLKNLPQEDPDYLGRKRQLDFAIACEEASRKKPS